MRVVVASLVGVAALGAGSSPAPAAVMPGIRQLEGRDGCVVVRTRDGCRVVRGVRGGALWFVSADSLNLYGLAFSGRSLVTLRRSAGGGFRQLRGHAGCLSVDRRASCGRLRLLGGEDLDLLVSPGGRSAFLVSAGGPSLRVVSLLRDPATGALRQAPRAGCVTNEVVRGCARIAGLGSDGILNALESRDGSDLYLVTYDGVVHLRRDPSGGLRQVAGAADCYQSVGHSCRRAVGIPSSTDDSTLSLSADGRTLYATFSGHEDTGGGIMYPGAVLQFARDPATGSLEQAPLPSGCASGFFEDESPCPEWSVLGALISDLTLASDTLGDALTFTLTEPGQTIVALGRDATSGALTPIAAPGSCWGVRPAIGDPDIPPSRLGEPCERVREWRFSALPSPPLLTADGRNLYIWSEATQNFADLPTLYGYSALVGFARDPASGRLARLPGPRGCLGARYVRTCRRLVARFVVQDAVEAAAGRAVVLAISVPSHAGPDKQLRLLRRGAAADGQLVPVPGHRGCATVGGQRGCRRVRGLSRTSRAGVFAPEVVASPDGRYVYCLLGAAVAVFRVDG